MAQHATGDYTTVTVIGSQVLARPDGRAAIHLQTKEMGSIAFEVSQTAIDALRRQLTIAEGFLRIPPSKN
ncbi:MAG: hypothetical protein WAK63_16080 [Xanthobacteraceae bacterium]